MNLSNIAKQLGSRGGKKSVESRFKGKTKQEISEAMRKIRYSKEQIEKMEKMGKSILKSFRAIRPHSDSKK